MKGSTALRRCAGIADPDIRARVRKGVRFCNKKFGNEWPDQVSVGDFNIQHSDRCIIGQLVPGKGSLGAWWAKLDSLGILNREAHEYGFDVSSNDWNTEEGFEKLNDAWLLVLGGR